MIIKHRDGNNLVSFSFPCEEYKFFSYIFMYYLLYFILIKICTILIRCHPLKRYRFACINSLINIIIIIILASQPFNKYHSDIIYRVFSPFFSWSGIGIPCIDTISFELNRNNTINEKCNNELYSMMTSYENALISLTRIIFMIRSDVCRNSAT